MAALVAVGGLLSWATVRNDVLTPALKRIHPTQLALSTDVVDIGPVAATAVLLVGRIHVDLLRVCAARCPAR